MEEFEEDDSFGYEEEDVGVDALGAMPDGVGSFSREDLINAQQLRDSVYKNKALKLIEKTDASMELKQALGLWVHNHFTTEIILADNNPRKTGIFKQHNPLDRAVAKADLELDSTYLSADKFDSMQPWYLSLQEGLMSVFEHYISRSQGKDRERLLTGKLTSSQEVKQVSESRVTQPEGEKKKRRWL